MKFGNVILAGVGLLFLAERAALRAQLPALNAQAAPKNHVLDLDGKGSFVELPPMVASQRATYQKIKVSLPRLLRWSFASATLASA